MLTPDQTPKLKRLLDYLALDPGNRALLGDVADEALDAGDAVHARMALERLGAEADADAGESADLTLDYRLAVLAFLEQRYADSLARSSSLLNAGCSEWALRHQHAQTLLKLGRSREAADLLGPLCQDGKAPAFTLPAYLRALHQAGDFETAITHARRHLAGNPGDGHIRGQLSLLYLDHEQFALAHEMAAQALQQSPENLDALLAGGGAAAALEKPELALQLYTRATALAPESARAWLGLGLVALAENDLPAAQGLLEKTVALTPGHLGSWNALAWVHILNLDLESAQAALEQAQQIDHNFGETWGAMAVVAALREDQDNAIRLARLALRLQPGSIAARYAQHLVAGRFGHREQSASLLESLLTDTQAPGGGTLKDLIRRATARSQRGAVLEKNLEPGMEQQRQQADAPLRPEGPAD